MNFFDFFFPEQAQAEHLRKLAALSQVQTLELNRQRVQSVHQQRLESRQTRTLEQRIAQLEEDLGQAALTIEALLELLEQSGTLTRTELETRARQIDANDGVIDGRITPPSPPTPEPPVPKRQWPGVKRP